MTTRQLIIVWCAGLTVMAALAVHADVTGARWSYLTAWAVIVLLFAFHTREHPRADKRAALLVAVGVIAVLVAMSLLDLW